jgi:hypothetical protein
MVTLAIIFVFLLALFVVSVVWIFRAVIAAFRREKRVWLYCGTPIAIAVAVWTAQRIFIILIGFAVALFNGGSGR